MNDSHHHIDQQAMDVSPGSGDNITGSQYWRSLDDLVQSPAFRQWADREFPHGLPEQMPSASRRNFLKLMAASFALGGAAILPGCRRWPERKISAHTDRPEGHIPGVAEYYATCLPMQGVAHPVLAKSYDGRPIKLEGNPGHPLYASRGTGDFGPCSSWTQASILQLYDPYRSRTPMRNAGQAGRGSRSMQQFDEFAKSHFAQLKNNQPDSVAILSQMNASPTQQRMIKRVLDAYPGAGYYEYEPVSWDNQRLGAVSTFGRSLRTHLHLNKAKAIVCFDADLLVNHPAAAAYARDYAETRASADQGRMSRLFCVEPHYSVTGTNADERIAVKPGMVGQLVQRLYLQLKGSTTSSLPTGINSERWEHLVESLRAAGRDGVVIAGEMQPPQVHAICHAINMLLNNTGRTVTYSEDPAPSNESHADQLATLTERMNAGEIDTLVILNGNPVYDAPADVPFAEALANVPTSIHLDQYDNETSQQCTWHVNAAHWLEAWGDARSYDGTISFVQPLILPLFNGRSAIEMLSLMLGTTITQDTAYEQVRQTFASTRGFRSWVEKPWRKALHDGYIADTAYPAVEPDGVNVPMQLPNHMAPQGTFEICFQPSTSVYDGRFANNGWLQEMPDPLTKLTWDNAALMSPKTAKQARVWLEDRIEVQIDGRRATLPVYPLPGMADDTIALPLGYGRTAAGHVGNDVGVNVYPLRTRDTMGMAIGATAVKTRGRSALASTQDHFAIDAGAAKDRAKRVDQFIRETNLNTYQKDPEFAAKYEHYPYDVKKMHQRQLWDSPNDERGKKTNQWGMTIDLNKCIGCAACTVACQAENNVPIVGKSQVLMSREMDWIRVDRYFQGDPYSTDVRVVHQPLTCHHCENAPCEQVCPVAATVHDSQGLNTMVYNRCVGTRYCSNNCPFKVRRFNYMQYHIRDPKGPNDQVPFVGPPDQALHEVDDLTKMHFNPDVTVRMRGVMEKCTFCTQRISEEVRKANWQQSKGEKDNNLVPDGAVTPACAQACPTQAIVFGDVSDPDTKVSQEMANPRSYGMLQEFNVRPRLYYQAKILNPTEQPIEHHGHGGADEYTQKTPDAHDEH